METKPFLERRETYADKIICSSYIERQNALTTPKIELLRKKEKKGPRKPVNRRITLKMDTITSKYMSLSK